MKKSVLIIIHFIVVLLSWTSWLWLSWRIIALIALLQIALLETTDGCFLSHAQFKDKGTGNTRFYEWWLGKIGIKNYNRQKLKIFMTYWLSIIIVLLGILVQEVFKLEVLY